MRSSLVGRAVDLRHARRRTPSQELSDDELIAQAPARTSLSHPHHEMERQRRLKDSIRELTSETSRARWRAFWGSVAIGALTLVLIALTIVLALADKTGLTGGLSKALATDRLLVHDRGRVLADLACTIADGAEVISDFRVMGDQEELFGLAASVPTCWRTLDEIAEGGGRALARITGAVNAARRQAWQAAPALPGVAIADKVLERVTCLRLDATVVTCHSDKEGAEPNFKGLACTRWAAGVTTPPSRWPSSCATPPLIIWRCWPRRSPRCHPVTGGG